MASDPVSFALQHAVSSLGDNVDPLLRATIDAVGTNVTAYFALTVVVAHLRLEGKYTGTLASLCDAAMAAPPVPPAALTSRVETPQPPVEKANASVSQFSTAADAIQHAARSAKSLYSMNRMSAGAAVQFENYTLRIMAVPARLCYEIFVSRVGVADRHYSVAALEVDKWISHSTAAVEAASAYMPRDASRLFVNLDKLVKSHGPAEDNNIDQPLPDDEPIQGAGSY